ncbi:hypothetical protein ACIFOT_28515 [Neobacillus sp. NRS-1170]|uniref:hypothetical protein n=1 Tax=Neobacillus sp. NRS-1170 TaxID=3233898 RepID=UPI003D2C8C08
MNSKEFQEIIAQLKIEERTIQGFWNVINNAKINDDDELNHLVNSINHSWLKLEIHKISFSIIYNYSEFIEAELRIYLNDTYIGSYLCAFTLDGKDSDDKIKMEDYSFISGLIALEERNEEIAKSAIEEKVDDLLIQRLTGLTLERINELKKL